MNGIASHKGIVSVFVAVAAVLLGLAFLGAAEAKQYKVGGGTAKSVDIRVSGNYVTGFEIRAPNKCSHGSGGVLSTKGKVFNPADPPFLKRLDSMRRFVIRVKLIFRGEFVRTTLIKGRVSSNKIRGGFSIKTFPDKEGLFDTCWTGKSRNDSYVKFVAKRKR